MPIDWFDVEHLKPLMAGKNIVRVGKPPAQYATVADFIPGGAVGHLVTAVSGTAGLDTFRGLIVYDTSADRLKYYDGSGWKTIKITTD